MKQIIFIAVLFFVFCFAVFAQDLNFEPLSRYEKTSANEEKAHLDNLFYALSQDKTDEGIIILEFDKKALAVKKIRRLRKIIEWAKFRKFDVSRISFMISDKDLEQTTLLVIQEKSKFFEDLRKDYKLVKAEKFEQQINKIFPRK